MPSEFNRQPVKNDGAVKINNGNLLLPGWRFGDAESINNQWQNVAYASPLGFSSFPTTSWPQNIDTPTDADIYDSVNETFIENTIPGQTHIWRIQLQFDKQGSGGVRLQVRLRNPISGFLVEDFVNFPGALDVGEFNPLLVTIADSASLPAPFGSGQGYLLEVMADNNSFQSAAGNFLEIVSVTRISLHYSSRP